MVNGVVTNVASCLLRPGDIVSVRNKSQGLEVIRDQVSSKSDSRKYPWLEFNGERMEGRFLEYPTREQVPENINEQLIVELYSK
jgi:small subunit ribosomal protein S4